MNQSAKKPLEEVGSGVKCFNKSIPPVFWVALVFMLPALIVSCTRPGQGGIASPAKNPVDSLFDNYQEQFFTDVKTGPHRQLDSVYHTTELTPKQQAKYYLLKSYIHRHLNYDPEKVLAYSDSMMSVAENYPNDTALVKFYTNALFAKAEMHKDMGNFRLAYNYFMEAKKTGQKYSDAGTAACINSTYDYYIGMIFFSQEKYTDAAASFISSYENNKFCDSNMLVIFRREELLNNIGLCFARQKMYDSALYYYNRAFQYMETLKSKWPQDYAFFDVAKGVISGNRAQVYYKQGDTARAIEGLLYNIKINLNYDRDIGDALTSAVHLSDIYLDAGKIQEAGRWIETAQKVIDTVPANANLHRNVYRLKWTYYKRLGRYDSAETYAARYANLNDSLDARDRTLQNTDIQATMGVLEKEYELNLLRKDMEARKVYTTLITIAGVLLIVVILVVLYAWRVLKKQNKTLEVQNRQINEKNRELKRLDQNKDRIMAIVAHDLRNPITAVYSLNNILQTYIPAENKEQHHILGMIETSCNTSLNLINEILLMSTMNHLEEKDLQKERVKMNEFLETTIGLLQFKADEKQQKLHLELPATDTELMLSTEKIRRALGNLVVNAIKFSKQGEEINIKAKLHNNSVLISVSDNGMGIPQDIQSKVFDVFTTAKRTGTSGEKPFGLGLSITKQIIEAHKGKIWFESREGKGTTFYVELPA